MVEKKSRNFRINKNNFSIKKTYMSCRFIILTLFIILITNTGTPIYMSFYKIWTYNTFFLSATHKFPYLLFGQLHVWKRDLELSCKFISNFCCNQDWKRQQVLTHLTHSNDLFGIKNPILTLSYRIVLTWTGINN